MLNLELEMLGFCIPQFLGNYSPLVPQFPHFCLTGMEMISGSKSAG